ncbi:MAG: substrate-binding domain-containing protein [Candidatus Eremiobacteraeota bacterium]|nr:substrate-binding domain-containing protein [Candidatus Eremiobacteraeota bacterium]
MKLSRLSTSLALVAGSVALLSGVAAAAGPSLNILCAAATATTVTQLAESYTRASGIPVRITAGTASQLREKLNAGERADLIILPAPTIDELDKSGVLVPGSRADLGRTGMGVGIRVGTKAPDLSSTEALKQALLAAKSVAYSDPAAGATSGIYFTKVLGQLGIADAVTQKAKLASGGSCGLVADGSAEICVGNVTQILGVKGVVLAGPFPAAVQNFITYSAGIPKNAPSVESARAFAGYLTDVSLAAVWNSAGF